MPVLYRSAGEADRVLLEDDATIAALHYTYYERTDVSDIARRPLFISFNGGPGSSSIWLQLANRCPLKANWLCICIACRYDLDDCSHGSGQPSKTRMR